MNTSFNMLQAFDWLDLNHDQLNGIVHAVVKYKGYTDRFEMSDSAIGDKGVNLMREAYERRAKLFIVEKTARELKA